MHDRFDPLEAERIGFPVELHQHIAELFFTDQADEQHHAIGQLLRAIQQGIQFDQGNGPDGEGYNEPELILCIRKRSED